MIPFADSIDAQVHQRPARHFHGNFFAKKEIRVPPQNLDGIDGVVVGYGYNGHAEVLEPLIDFRRVVVRLPADPAQDRSVEHSRSNRVNVEVASHAIILGLGYEQSMKRPRILDECVPGTSSTHGTSIVIHMASSVLFPANPKRMT